MRAYWFGGDTLPNGDDRPVAVGVTHAVKPPIIPCQWGLHASVHPADALTYANGPKLWLVELGGIVVGHGNPLDKYAASERSYLASIDAADLMRKHACWNARRVLHLWDAPQSVREYLSNPIEALRLDAYNDAEKFKSDTWRSSTTDKIYAAAAAAVAAHPLPWVAAFYVGFWVGDLLPSSSVERREYFSQLIKAAFWDKGVK